MENKTLWLNGAAIGIVGVLIIGSGIYLFTRSGAPSGEGANATSTSATSTASTTVVHTPQGDIIVPAGTEVEVIGLTNAEISARLSAGTKAMQARDYAGAAAIWEKLAVDAPMVAVSYINLGNLYRYQLRDYAKSEKWYKGAIQTAPTNESAYLALFELYTQTSYKPSNTAAADILKKGIVALPKAYELQVMLARHYLEAGRTAEAKTTFDAAIANAKAQGKTEVAAQLQEERDAIK